MNFIDNLATLNRGRFFADLEEKLLDVTAGVRNNRKAGSVTVTISLSMNGQEEDQLDVKAKITAKRPERDPSATTMFITKDGLSTRDPKQRNFDELIEIDTSTGVVIDPLQNSSAG